MFYLYSECIKIMNRKRIDGGNVQIFKSEIIKSWKTKINQMFYLFRLTLGVLASLP